MIRMFVLIAALLLAVLPTAASATPAAGAQGFLAAEHPHDGFWGGPASDGQLLDIGYTACAHHQRGLSDEQVLQAMMGGPEMALPAGSEAHRLGLQRVRNAVRYLC